MPEFSSYVSLGDSMSIDAYSGPGLGAASLLNSNVDECFPEFSGLDLQTRWPGLTHLHLARDGATTHDVLASLQALAPPTGRILFTLTIGGNDLLQGRLRNPHTAITNYAENLGRILDTLLESYGDRCLILQATLYDPSDGVGDLLTPGIPNPGLVQLVARANEVVRNAAASRAEVEIADVHAHFLGHGSHAEDEQGLHYQPDDPRPWLKLGIEPNQLGGSEVRRVFWNTLQARLPAPD